MEWKEQNISNLRKSFHQTSLLNIIEEELIKFSLCKETPAQISYLIKKIALSLQFSQFSREWTFHKLVYCPVHSWSFASTNWKHECHWVAEYKGSGLQRRLWQRQMLGMVDTGRAHIFHKKSKYEVWWTLSRFAG